MNSSLMQRLTATVLLVLGHGLLAGPLQAVEASVPSGLHRTNVILIMADDVGWEAFGAYGGQQYQTPRLDELCRRGLRLSQCYSTPLCTPSRVQIMTGKYNFRNYTHFGYLDPAEYTFGQLMREAGYATAIAGKWQLNGLANNLPGWDDSGRPHHFGFDEYLLWQLTHVKGAGKGGGERYWSPLLECNGRVLSIQENEGKYGPDMMCDFVCDFIERHQQQPFFVYYPMLLVHDPFVPTPETIGAGSRGHETNQAIARQSQQNFAAMVHYMDSIVGRIVDKLASLQLLDDTLVLFTSDNGTNRNIRSRWQGRTIQGGKGGTTDMGTHVPLIAYWRGHTPAGAVVDDLVDFSDFFPTLAELVGGDASGCDGQSFLPQLRGQPGHPRPFIVCHYQPFWGDRPPAQFVRNQRYKLYRDGRMYALPDDLEESQDLATADPSAEALAAKQLLSSVIARLPPLPPGVGNQDTHQRTTYLDWPKVLTAAAAESVK